VPERVGFSAKRPSKLGSFELSHHVEATDSLSRQVHRLHGSLVSALQQDFATTCREPSLESSRCMARATNESLIFG
jgi:hypothetical protein